MHSFLWAGKDSEGNKRAERVLAENVSHAESILTGRGWTELELIKSEIHDAVKNTVVTSPFGRPDLTPDEEVAYFKKTGPGFLRQWWQSIVNPVWENIWSLLMGVVVLVIAALRHQTVLFFFCLGAMVLVLFLFPPLHYFFHMSARNFKRLQKARVDGDWQEVLKCVERLRRSRELTKIGLSDEELVRNRAIALARLGHLDRGLAEYNKILEISKTPDWLMTTHLSSIYDAGLQYEKTFELRMQAISQKPTATAVYIDAALTAVCRLNRAAEARELLSKLGNRKFSSLENGFMHFVTGVILWREKNPAKAKGELEQALQELKPRAEKTPLTRGTLLRIKSYLAVVNDELGASDCAQVLFRETRHYLKTHQEFELLNLLEKFA